ncbi:MAG: Dabb family protein [Bacteroidales bacterium]
MKKVLFFTAVLMFLYSCENQQSERLLRHVVLFSFQETATPEEIRAVEEAFAALPGKISEIHDFEWGTDVSVENISRGYTHCFLVTFKSEADRDAYLPHPDHREFGKVLSPILQNVIVVDYWTN